MARGFWKGMFHGAVISIAGLAALSILAPSFDESEKHEDVIVDPVEDVVSVPEEAATIAPTLPDVAPSFRNDDELNQPKTNNVDATEPAPRHAMGNDKAAEAGEPRAGVVDLPAGSEFGRGEDVIPQMPDPMGYDQQSRQSDPPAVSAPTAEPAPVAFTDPGVRPVTDSPDISPDRPVEIQADETASPDLPEVQAVTETPQAPSMIRAGEADRLPSELPGEFRIDGNTDSGNSVNLTDRDAINDLQVFPVQNVPRKQNYEEQTDNTTVTPRLPSPGLDLSTPPDLSDLNIQN